MAGLIQNKKLDFFTTHLATVDYKGKEFSLGFADKCKIFAAFFFGSFLFGVGALLGFQASKSLRERAILAIKVKPLVETSAQCIATLLIKQENELERLKAEELLLNSDFDVLPVLHGLNPDEIDDLEGEYATTLEGLSLEEIEDLEEEFIDDEREIELLLEAQDNA